MTTKEIIQYAKDHPSGKVKIAFSDIDGILRGKYISSEKFLSVIETGMGFCDVIFGWDQHTYTEYNNPATDSGGLHVNISDGGMNVGTWPRQRTVTTAIGFFGIPDAQSVETLMVKTFGEGNTPLQSAGS